MADTEIGGLIVKMKADLSDYQAKLDLMDKTTVKTTDKVTAAFGKMTTIMAVTGAAMGGFATTAIKAAMDWGNAVDDLSDKTGMVAEEASKLLVVAKRVGISTEEANMMFSRFARSAYNAADAQAKAAAEGKTADDAYTRLGIAITNADGTMRSASEVFGDVKDKIAAMPDGLQKTALEMELFGRSGANMHDLLHMTKEEMQAVIEKAQALGLILNDEQKAGWEKLKRDVGGVKGTLSSIGITIGNELMPQIQQMIGNIQGATKAFVSLDPELRSSIISTIKLGSEIGIASFAITKGVGAVESMAVSLGIMRAATLSATAPWFSLAAAIGLAANAYLDYMDNKNKLQWYTDAEVYSDPDRPGKHTKKEWSNDTGVTELGTTTGGYVRVALTDDEEGKVSAAATKREKPDKPETPPPDIFLGGGGGESKDSSTKTTEYEKYKQDTQDMISMWERQVSLEQLTSEGLANNVKSRLAGLEQVNVLDKEINDKNALQADLQQKINEAMQQAHSKAIETAQTQMQLGIITKQQYADVVAKQLESATTEKERLSLTQQLASAQDAVINEQITQMERLQAIQKLVLSSQQEGERHKLEMTKIFSDSSYETVKANLAAESELKKKGLTDDYNLELKLLNDKISLYESKAKPLTEKEKEDYEAFLQAKKLLTDKYNLEMEKANNSYTERVASEQKKIIDANNSMISDMITGTKTGHDILKDMWSDFVNQIVAKMFSIKSEMNIFSALFGGIFGLNSGVNLTGSRAAGVSGPVGSNGGFYKNAGGGYITGAGTETSDSILSWLSNGEFVIKAASVKKYGKDFFVMLNNGVMPRFANGGIVAANNTSIIPNSTITSGQVSQQSSSQTVVVQPQVTIQQSFQSLDPAENMRLAKAQNESLKNEILTSIKNETAWRSAIRGAVR